MPLHIFERIDVKGQKLRKMWERFWKMRAEKDCGYVVVPKGVKFSDLKMEMKLDKGNAGEATLIYTYEGNVVGSAKAKVSEKYAKEHRVEIKGQEKKVKKSPDSSTGKSLKEMLIIVILAVLLLLLTLLFIAKLRQYRRKTGKKTKKIPEKIEPAEQGSRVRAGGRSKIPLDERMVHLL